MSAILSNIPKFETSSYSILKSKVMPALKLRLLDKKDQKRPKIRKFVAVALFKIINLFQTDEKGGELQRLLLILSRQYKHKEEGVKESVMKSVIELLKSGCPQQSILKEFNHGLDPELFALFLTKIIPTGTISITSENLSVFHQILLEYEQYPTYYYIAKEVPPNLLENLLASTKTFNYISQGLAENVKVSPEDFISLGLSLIHSEKKKENKQDSVFSLKEATFCIQPYAATGTREKKDQHYTPISAEKVVGIRLLKIGVKKCKEIDPDVMVSCKNAALECLSIKKDEAVIGALEVLRVVGDSSVIDKVIKTSEKAGEEVLIHSMKTLASLIKTKNTAEIVASAVLSQIIFALQSFETQSSALKLLKIFVGFRIMDEVIYDAIEEIPRILVSNLALSSQVCFIYSQFLILYPLSDKRKNFHLDFLVKNLGNTNYVANDGIIEALKVVLDKFPYEEFKDYYEFLLLALITAISNESAEKEIENYLLLACKAAKLNTNSSIILKIFG